MHEYSNENELTELKAKLAELLNPNVSGKPLSVEEIQSGVYDTEAKVKAVMKAIGEHSSLKDEEYQAFIGEEKAKNKLELQKAAYLKVVEYVNHLKAADEIAKSVQGGYGFHVSDCFPTEHPANKAHFKTLLRLADHGLAALVQYK